MFSFFNRKKTSSAIAKDRLKVLVQYDRANTSTDNNTALIEKIKKELIEVLQRNLGIDKDKLKVNVKEDSNNLLSVDIEMPEVKRNLKKD